MLEPTCESCKHSKRMIVTRMLTGYKYEACVCDEAFRRKAKFPEDVFECRSERDYTFLVDIAVNCCGKRGRWWAPKDGSK